MAAAGWTKARRRAVEAYVAELAPRLRLADWRIVVSWEVAEGRDGEEAWASITPTPRTKAATLRLGPAFLTLSPAEQTQTLCHELIHCHFFPTVELVEATFGLLGAGERRAAGIGLEQHVEHAVDDLADAFAPLVAPLCLDGSPAR